VTTAVADGLGTVLDRELGRILEEPVAAVRPRERRFPGAYESCVLEVELESGRAVELFLKDLGSCPDFKDDRRARRERELFMYRDVLAGAQLGTARYYGCVDDRWLFLEFVDGIPVRYCDMPDWHRVVRWLGRMQGAFAGRIGELRASGRLGVRDTAAFREMAARALRSVREFSDGYEGRLARALGRWDDAADAMAEGPPTLVHSAYRPAEVLIADAGGEPRVCPVDWELAAIGSTLFDFANFTDGFEGDELDSLLGAYRDEAALHGWRVPDGDRARFVIECHRLYKHLTLLSHAFPRRYPLDEVEAILAGFEREAAATLG
jgi:hypothetical protein